METTVSSFPTADEEMLVPLMEGAEEPHLGVEQHAQLLEGLLVALFDPLMHVLCGVSRALEEKSRRRLGRLYSVLFIFSVVNATNNFFALAN